MTRRYVNQLINGDAVDEAYLVADKQLRANRQGNLYLHLELRDKSGTVGARLWNASEGLARTFKPGDYLLVRGKTQIFQGALQIILSDPNVKAVMFNIFGGITRVDEVARGIIAALDEVPTTVPMIARLVGTNEVEGRKLLAESKLIPAATLAEAAQQAVAAAQGR